MDTLGRNNSYNNYKTIATPGGITGDAILPPTPAPVATPPIATPSANQKMSLANLQFSYHDNSYT